MRVCVCVCVCVCAHKSVETRVGQREGVGVVTMELGGVRVGLHLCKNAC
jgi:hypothetical protein